MLMLSKHNSSSTTEVLSASVTRIEQAYDCIQIVSLLFHVARLVGKAFTTFWEPSVSLLTEVMHLQML